MLPNLKVPSGKEKINKTKIQTRKYPPNPDSVKVLTST